jgi:hypothetical protein
MPLATNRARRAHTPGKSQKLLLAVIGCYWLLLAVVFCSWLLLAVVFCCWLLLALVDCCWLLLALVGCYWLLLSRLVGVFALFDIDSFGQLLHFFGTAAVG